MSWLVTADVEQGRDKLNFSRWDDDENEADDAGEAVADGDMPPRRYELAHPDARLSAEERRQLIAALVSMEQGGGGGSGSGHGGPGSSDD